MNKNAESIEKLTQKEEEILKSKEFFKDLIAFYGENWR